MNCIYCGNVLEEGTLTCPYCGQTVYPDPKTFNLNVNGSVQSKPNSKKIIAIIVAVVVSLIAMLTVGIIAFNSANSVKIEDYIAPLQFEGYDGFGSITNKNTFIDYEAIQHSITGYDTESIIDSHGIYGISEYVQTEAAIKDSIDVKFANEDSINNLSNGDVVTYTITVDYDQINQYASAHKLKGKKVIEVSSTVEGLTPVEEFDPFSVIDKIVINKEDGERYLRTNDNVDLGDNRSFKLSYSTVTIYDSEDKYLFEYRINVPEYKNAKTGDKLTLSIKEDADRFVEKGIVFSSTEKSVECVECHPFSEYDKIDSVQFEKIKEYALDYFATYKTEDYEYVDCYIYSDKTLEEYDKSEDENCYTFVTKYFNNSGDQKYSYAYAENLLISDDGKILFDQGKYGYCNTYLDFDSFSEMQDFLTEIYMIKFTPQQ